jgi:1-acyl-sn-glycerol-3-phosphate acyltransferase
VTVLHDPSPQAAAAPFGCEPRRWPRSKEQAGRLSMLIREHMLVHWDLARASTGHELPGPLPADEVEPDPATGVTEQGAS